MKHIEDPAKFKGRYRREGAPGAWYASSSEEASWKELSRVAEGVPLEDLLPRRMSEVHVGGLSVLDLTDPSIRSSLGLDGIDLTSSDESVLDVLAQVGAWACGMGYGGILAPSAAVAEEKTLIVFKPGMDCVHVERQGVYEVPPASPEGAL